MLKLKTKIITCAECEKEMEEKADKKIEDAIKKAKSALEKETAIKLEEKKEELNEKSQKKLRKKFKELEDLFKRTSLLKEKVARIEERLDYSRFYSSFLFDRCDTANLCEKEAKKRYEDNRINSKMFVKAIFLAFVQTSLANIAITFFPPLRCSLPFFVFSATCVEIFMLEYSFYKRDKEKLSEWKLSLESYKSLILFEEDFFEKENKFYNLKKEL